MVLNGAIVYHAPMSLKMGATGTSCRVPDAGVAVLSIGTVRLLRNVSLLLMILCSNQIGLETCIQLQPDAVLCAVL